MDPQALVSKWIVEYLIRQNGIDDSMLDHLVGGLSVDDYGVKKGLVIRRIQTEVSKVVVSEKMLKLLELVVEMDFDEGKSPSEPVKSAYCAVALDLTVRFLEVGDYRVYSETLQRIWRDRVEKMEAFGVVTGELLRWRDALEAASSNVEIRNKILSRNTRYEALRAVQRYLVESWKELGLPFLETLEGFGGRPEREERGDDNQKVTIDQVEFTQETSPKRRRTTPVKTSGVPKGEERGDDNQKVTTDQVEFTQETSPKRRRTTPVKTSGVPKGEMRRTPRKWTVSEEDTLRTGVGEFGKGNWKAILKKYCDELEGRTEVDLKDKWRNLSQVVRAVQHLGDGSSLVTNWMPAQCQGLQNGSLRRQ